MAARHSSQPVVSIGAVLPSAALGRVASLCTCDPPLAARGIDG
jgi:hypothetical protein